MLVVLSAADLAAEEAAFKPPTHFEQVAAVGNLEGLSPVARRAFEVTNEFSTIYVPKPMDWLGSFQEKTQTFDAFLRSGRNTPTATARTLYLQPFGQFVKDESPDLNDLRDYCVAFFALPVKLLPSLPLPNGGRIKSRIRENGLVQFLTDDFLELLKSRLPPDAFCVLGVTMEDLYPDEKWNFVFGQASLSDRVGVFSFKRFTPTWNRDPWNDETRHLLLRRSCDVLAHETGHMFGLSHCTFFECVMCGSNNLAEADGRPMHICPVCLRKLHSSIHFDILSRYRALLAFDEKHGLKDEAAWVKKRLERLAQ